ncbi:hypothetical protein GCM10007913_26390 [Devosia yakushimensis]|uniref:DUF1499 domain-containing protein n=1 Tax=Devosia yakushimensis TaxID=470028 RepID=A0ABQ5UH23_9HYPH|nr:DUF1499 domain-containing protein [Devosia yakushimensis]GLQ10707.1 hypothetical protein GCM10007913_26390 [Devosia yakushimensis]
MRILIRTSRWAIWARRLGTLALPLVVIPVLLHRERFITSDVFLVAVVLAGLVAAIAFFASLIALGRLWHTGDHGWGKALAGLALSLLCLAPFGWYGSLMLRYPPATDMATTTRGALPLVFEPGTAAMPAPKLLTSAQMAAIFPNVQTRTYPLVPEQTFALVERMVAERGWDVRLRREPVGDAPGRINAQAMTLPGWREEAVLRVTATEEGSAVDMRSASLNALHDFGSNGQRIEEFLIALDDAVTVLLRDNPTLEPEGEAEAVTPVPVPAN